MARADGTDPAMADTPTPLDGDGRELLGRVIDGRYRLDATLGRGGMGLVYRAAHVGLRRQVAVKILHPSLAASPDVRNRFEREALAVGKINHPNCVSVYDVGRLPDGSLYLAMELLDGRPLADVLEQEGQIAPGRALHILAGILRGLSHIHAAGLIHRDIKPENIFLIRHGQDEDFAKILDFGIAKAMKASDLDDGVKLTQAGMAFGTPIYMAPEQALGNPMDGRADLYAASVMAYEMLAGQPPFYSDDKLEVMSMHTARPVPPMRTRMIKGGRAVPSSIERLVVRGLTKKPSERWASADVYLAEVEQALRTPDGGVTDVNFERPPSVDTGSQPLVTDDGQVNLANEFADEDSSASIADAISDALAHTPSTPTRIPPTPRPQPTGPTRVQPPPTRATGQGRAVPPSQPPPLAARVATPPRGLPPSVASQAGGAQSKSGAMGGVGLGLPYTGPSGEPIFGLTPEQRLAGTTAAAAAAEPSPADSGVASALEPDQDTRARTKSTPRVRKRLGLYLVIAACAAALGVLGALLWPSSGKPALDPSSPAGAAQDAYERGQPARAIQILEANKAAIAADPQAQLILGHAHAAKHESSAALAAYAVALRLSSDLERDGVLRANLRAMAADRDATVVAAAFDLWAGATQDAEGKQLVEKAAVSEDLARRHAVAPVIEKYKLGDDVDWLRAYTFDLAQEATCPARKEAVGKLRALGDPRAVEPLELAIQRKGLVGATRGKLINGCLADDAKAAIGYLRGLPKR